MIANFPWVSKAIRPRDSSMTKRFFEFNMANGSLFVCTKWALIMVRVNKITD